MGSPANTNSLTLQNTGSSFPPLPQRALTSALHMAYIKGDALRVSPPSWDTPLMHPRTALPPWGASKGCSPGQLLRSVWWAGGYKRERAVECHHATLGPWSIHTVHPEEVAAAAWKWGALVLFQVTSGCDPHPTYLCGIVEIKCSWQRALLTQSLLAVICSIPNLFRMVTKGKLAEPGGKVTWVSCPV